MGAIDKLIKERRKEHITDLVNVFGPIDKRIVKPFVTMVYDNCYSVCLKEHPYWQEAASLAKVLTAKQLEDFIKGEAGLTDESGEKSETNTEPEPSELPTNPAAPEETPRRKVRFV